MKGLNGFRFFCQETAQFLHGFGFDLADAFGRYAVFGSQFVQGQTAIVLQPAAFNDMAAAVVQLCQGVFADLRFAGRSGLVWTTDG